MKKTVILFLFVLAFFGNSFAQSQFDDFDPKTYFAPVNLTEEQKPGFKEVNMIFIEDMKTLNNDEMSKFKKLRAMNKFRKKRNKSMKDLLAKEQYAVWLDLQKALEKRARQEFQKNQ